MAIRMGTSGAPGARHSDAPDGSPVSAGTGLRGLNPAPVRAKIRRMRTRDRAQKRGRTTRPRVTVDPARMGGMPCIRGLRIPVATIVGMIAEGIPEAEILANYPDLEPPDIRAALTYAADALRERTLPLARE